MIETKQEKIRALRAETLYTLVEKIDQWVADSGAMTNVGDHSKLDYGAMLIATMTAMRASGTDIIECLGEAWQVIKGEGNNV